MNKLTSAKTKKISEHEAKTAVVYDKWLHSLGGGEVVACSIAKILSEEGYKVLFISGKEVSPEIILDKLKIDLTGMEFAQVWNDEGALKKLSENKDLFINISFMDYSRGFSRKNFYYVNFPTKLYDNLKGMLVNRLILPLVSKFIQPVESLNQIDAPVVIHDRPAYALGTKNKYALSNLKINKSQQVIFKIYLENFSKDLLEDITVSFENAKILSRKVEVKHHTNSLKFSVEFIPDSETAYLNLNIKDLEKHEEAEEGRVFLFYPKMYLSKMQNFLFLDFLERASIRLRAGIFTNVSKRLSSYQKIITYSKFAKKWIRKYWKLDAVIIAPPVDLLFEKYKIWDYKKNNSICSVGRFFTLGHGKKQEILIEAFKVIYDKGYKDWDLHLVGGLGDEPSSIDFFKYLKEKSKGYPIFFHINVSAKEVEDVYLKSKIYWHATGFGEDEHTQPVRFEHFGIAPIEAISAGCIPILFNGGGLPEIIETLNLNVEKYTFDSIDSLVKLTINQLNYIPGNKNQFSWDEIFKLVKNNYSKEIFKQKFLDIID